MTTTTEQTPDAPAAETPLTDEQLEEQTEEAAERALTVTGDTPLDDVKRLALMVSHAGYFKDITGGRTQQVAQAMVKILAGQEIGLGPIASMRGVYLTDRGDIAYMANIVASSIKRSQRYDYRVAETTNDECVITFYEMPIGHEVPGGQALTYLPVGTATFSMADAERAGLASKDNWKRYPKAMLWARALSAGARMFCPDLFDGPVYTPEEVGVDGVDDPDEYIDATLAPAPNRLGEPLEPTS